jgi:type I restriction enzyme S subunit
MSAECSAGNIPPGYKQTEVGVIPEDWNIEPLRCDVTLLSGQHVLVQHCNTSGDGVPYLTGPADFPNGKIQQTKFTNRPTTLCKAGDILVTVKGSGSGTLVEADNSYCISRQLMAIRVKEWNAKFLFYFLLYNASKIKTSSTGLIPGLSRFDILDQEIPLPPTLAEQEAIGEALSDADAFIESLEQLIAKKRQIKQGDMQELLTGRRRLPGFSGEWETKPLGEVIDSCSSGATPYRGRPDYYKGKVKWITSGELNYNLITDTLEHISDEAVEHTNLKVHPIGTFLMAITGLEAAGTRGACGIVGSPATTNQSCMAIYPTSELKTEYLYHYYVFHGNELALQYCQGTKQQSYTAKLVKLLPIDLPPSIGEQTAIVTILSDMDSEITALEEKLAKTRQIKQGMMQELLTGKIRLI